VLRALLYWFFYYQLHYRPAVRFSLAHSTLVIHDRHLIDAVVDPQRYRYSGPASLIRAIWRSIRQPNLIVLLDVPTEVLQQRKQEVPPEESARQREAYRLLLETMPEGKLVDAGRPLNDVIGSVEAIILSYLTARVRSRLRSERRATSHSDSSAMDN
jgi:thymidylate kinase